MKPINKRDNDWFFDGLENRINKGLDNPKKTIVKFGLLGILVWILLYAALIAMIVAGVVVGVRMV